MDMRNITPDEFAEYRSQLAAVINEAARNVFACQAFIATGEFGKLEQTMFEMANGIGAASILAKICNEAPLDFPE